MITLYKFNRYKPIRSVVKLKKVFSLLLFIYFFSPCFAQETRKEIEILHADFMDFNKKETKAKRLKGHVEFKHENAIMSCDSAYFFSDENFVDAYGHVVYVLFRG